MNFTIPIDELEKRWARCRNLCRELAPDAEGVILFSRVNIYYFTGTFVNGVVFLPLDGEPVLFCRKGIERAKIESPLKRIISYNSYKDIKNTLTDAGIPFPQKLAVEMNGLSWALSFSLAKHWSGHEFIPGDKAIALTRSQKTEWELGTLREAGARHNKCMTQLLPGRLEPGMSEAEIAYVISDLFFREGHQGILRMDSFGEEVFGGLVCAGESANYSTTFNGPAGGRGLHPSAPYMGSGEIVWTRGKPLFIDNGFSFEGYLTDKTQVYWQGDQTTIPEPFQAAHDFCVDLQNWVAEHLRPGEIPQEIWTHCQNEAANSPWADGFMGLGKNQVHFAGHGIGLAIDEYPALAAGFDWPLEEGMVIAVEPKIGIPGLGMAGTENTFEVTPQGGKSLTGEAYDIICV